jgi:hypothetical protein
MVSIILICLQYYLAFRIKKIFFFFILLILALLVITLPVWIDRALPIMKNGINSAGETLENMWVALKFITDRLAQDFGRLLDKYG